MNRQDGPLLVGALNENTNSAKPLKVNNAGELLVTSGGSSGGGTSSTFGAAFPADGTAAGFIDSSGNMAGGTLDASGFLKVNVAAGSSGNAAASATGAAVPASADYLGVNVGGNLSGVSGGHGTAATALRVELPTDGTGVIATVGAVTAISNALPAGTNVIGHVIADSGSTTAVTGNVTVIQGTATNLKAQAEAYQGGTAVGAANPLQVSLANTGANATAVAVSLAAAPTTSVTQGTSPWIVAGGGTAGTAASGVATIQGIASMTPVQVSQATAGNLNATVVLTTGSAQIGHLEANQSVNLAQIAGTTTAVNSGNKDNGTQRVVIATDQPNLTSALNVSVASKTVYQRAVYGAAQTVFNLATDIAAGNFSTAGTDFTNNDATVGAVLWADAMIEMPDWAAAPVAGTTVDLYGLLINVDGTDDDTDAPSGTAQGGARYLGSWIIAAADALQRRTITISLAGIQNGFTPYVKNGTAQNMNNDGGTNMVLKITPWTIANVG